MQKAKWTQATSLFIVFRLCPNREGVRMTNLYPQQVKYRNLRKNLKYYLRLVIVLLEIIKRIVDLIS